MCAKQTKKTSNTVPPSLIEGEDYYVEKGFMVFTSTYLKKRGYCCHNGCRHCPYEIKNPPLD